MLQDTQMEQLKLIRGYQQLFREKEVRTLPSMHVSHWLTRALGRRARTCT